MKSESPVFRQNYRATGYSQQFRNDPRFSSSSELSEKPRTNKEKIIDFIFGIFLGMLILGAFATFSSLFVAIDGTVYPFLESLAVYCLTFSVLPFVFLSFVFAAKWQLFDFDVSPKTIKIIKILFFLFFSPLVSIWLTTGLSAIFNFSPGNYESFLSHPELIQFFWLLAAVIYLGPIILGLFVRSVHCLFKHQVKKKYYVYLTKEELEKFQADVAEQVRRNKELEEQEYIY